MFELNGFHLGDTWFQSTADKVHLFFLTCPDRVERHTCWSIGHASSEDLVHWEHHGILFDSDPGDPLNSCLSTGSVCRFGDRWIMAFLRNHNQPDSRTGYAESKDLHSWKRIPEASTGIDGVQYTRRGSRAFKNPRWRDPFLFVEDDWLYQLTTAAVEDAPEDADGVVGVMRTRDLLEWETLPPLITPRLGMDLECPKLYRIDGRYHLIVSLFNVLQSPEFASQQPPGLNPSTSFSLVADRLEGPYVGQGSCRILPKDSPGIPYACEALCFRNQWFLLGTCWSNHRPDHICDAIPLEVTDAGFRASSLSKSQPIPG
jgi:beta-fructofuranosidase